MMSSPIKLNIKIRQNMHRNAPLDFSQLHAANNIPNTNDEADKVNFRQLINSQKQLNDLFKAFLKQNIVSKPAEDQNSDTSDSVEDNQCINISNSSTKQTMQYGGQFENMLDPRDRVLQHNFDFDITIDETSIKQGGFLKSKTYAELIEKIRQFMVQTLANILSISFKLLSKNQLDQKQARNYATTNIMLNVHSLYSKTVEAIVTSKKLQELGCFLKDKQTSPDFQQLKLDLLIKMQSMMKNILNNQDAYYPQAPITGASLRMKRVVHEVNRTEDEENDLIYSNKNYFSQLKLRSDEDYTDFIMKVVNCAIKVVQAGDGDSRDRVNKEIFNEFNRELFALSQNQQFKALVQHATKNNSPAETKLSTSQGYKAAKKEMKEVTKQAVKQLIINYFELITETKSQKLQTIKDKIINNSLCSSINKQRTKNIQQLKEYAISLKIPNYVKQFTKQQIAEKQFRAKNSSILRILTKWAENLQEIMFNPEQHILMRLYPFKDIYNNLIPITDQSIKHEIVSNIKRQQDTVRQKLKRIKTRNLELISQIATAATDSLPYYVYRYSETRQVSSKINAVLASLMVQYLSVLIHHLLFAGLNIYDEDGVCRCINLVMLKVGDLMRARFKCSQTSFITLLKTMYLLDQSKTMKGKFKLVRIQNKLEESANHILVNYMFMGRVQCQLQLSIQESRGKQKSYFIFSQFISELRKSKFGVLSQSAIMMSQLDPILARNCDDIYYHEKKQEENEFLQSQQQKQDDKLELQIQKSHYIFYCPKCKKLVINENRTLFEQTQATIVCAACLFAQQSIQAKIGQQDAQKAELKKLLIQSLGQASLKRITNYQQLNHTDIRYYLRVTTAAQMHLEILIYIPGDLQHFLVRVDDQLLQKIINHQLTQQNASQVDYVCISKQIKKRRIISNCLFYEVVEKQELSKYLSKLGFSSLDFQPQIDQLIAYFQSFMNEKRLIQSIKFKAQIINFSNEQQKWHCLNRILRVYSHTDHQTKESQIKKLKYSKYKQLQFQQIKSIIVQKNTISENNEHMLYICRNLEYLKITNNQNMKNVNFLKNITSMNRIDLQNNSLQNVDGLLHLTFVNRLNLSRNKLQNVDGLVNCTAIEVLNLKENCLRNVDGLQNLKSIKQLYLDKNYLENVDGLINCTDIEILSLTENCLQNVEGLKNLRHVDYLFLSKNKLQNLYGLTNCIDIVGLELDHNYLTNINSLKNISNVQRLDLGHNKLKNVDALSNYSYISTLYLQHNNLTNVDVLQHCAALKELNLEHNNLRSIDCLKKNSHLWSLNVMNNQQLAIGSLPPNISVLAANYKQLRKFDFRDTHKLRQLTSDRSNPKLYKNLAENVILLNIMEQDNFAEAQISESEHQTLCYD